MMYLKQYNARVSKYPLCTVSSTVCHRATGYSFVVCLFKRFKAGWILIGFEFCYHSSAGKHILISSIFVPLYRYRYRCGLLFPLSIWCEQVLYNAFKLLFL